jgi:hypothetical protein
MSAKIAKFAPQLVGKTIAHIVLKAGDSPASQLFLLFTDGTYYEFFGGPIAGANGIDRGTLEDVLRYMSPPQKIVVDV